MGLQPHGRGLPSHVAETSPVARTGHPGARVVLPKGHCFLHRGGRLGHVNPQVLPQGG